MSTKIRARVKLQKKKIIRASKSSSENYYSELTGIDGTDNIASHSSLRNFTRNDEKIMNIDGNGFIFRKNDNKNNFLLDNKVAIVRFRQENNIRDLIKEQIVHEDYDKIYFFGDKTYEGGNDYEIFIDERVLGNSVKNPENTIELCTKYFF